jgi:hypothetical protein
MNEFTKAAAIRASIGRLTSGVFGPCSTSYIRLSTLAELNNDVVPAAMREKSQQACSRQSRQGISGHEHYRFRCDWGSYSKSGLAALGGIFAIVLYVLPEPLVARSIAVYGQAGIVFRTRRRLGGLRKFNVQAIRIDLFNQ